MTGLGAVLGEGAQDGVEKLDAGGLRRSSHGLLGGGGFGVLGDGLPGTALPLLQDPPYAQRAGEGRGQQRSDPCDQSPVDARALPRGVGGLRGPHRASRCRRAAGCCRSRGRGGARIRRRDLRGRRGGGTGLRRRRRGCGRCRGRRFGGRLTLGFPSIRGGGAGLGGDGGAVLREGESLSRIDEIRVGERPRAVREVFTAVEFEDLHVPAGVAQPRAGDTGEVLA